MLRLLKKIIFSFLAAQILFLSVAPGLTVHAQGYTPTWYAQGPADFWSKVYDLSNPNEIFGERYTAAQVQWVFYSVIMFVPTMLFGPKFPGLVGCVFNFTSGTFDINQCVSLFTTGLPEAKPVAEVPQQPQYSNQSLLSAVFADRPLSGISYVRDKVDNFKVVKPARAQTIGFGFDALRPVQGMWSGVRNIAFSFFVVIAVVFAFLVMFRVKLSPQTVVTVQSALPKIVFAIITVTFSYAIAGFLIDFMYVVIGLVSVAASQIFSFAFVNAPPVVYFNFLTLGQPINITIPVVGTINPQIGVFGILVMYVTFFLFSFGLVLLLNLGIVGASVAALLTGAIIIFAPMVAVFLLLVLLLIIVIGVIIAVWQTIRIIWMLLKAFVNVILLTIFAPVQLTLGIVIPNFGLSAWIRSYLSALSVFVVTGLLILFAYVFMMWGVGAAAQSFAAGALNGLFQAFFTAMGGSPSLLGGFLFGQNGWPPLLGLGGGWVGLLLLGVSFVVYTNIPKSAEMVQAFMQGKPFAYGSAIGEALGPIAAGGRAAWGLSGGRDMTELAQFARRARMMEKYFGENARDNYLRDAALWFIGGDRSKAKGALDQMLKNYRQRSGAQYQ